MKTINDLLQEMTEASQQRLASQLEVARRDYHEGAEDCKNGIYDKWYRYNHEDCGIAYDLGWTTQNQITQNETVTFLGAPAQI